jgi:hypothetical protein
MKNAMHLVTNNAALFQAASIEISTISLPCEHNGNWFETALMTQGGVEPIAQYPTMPEAVLGHQRLARQYGCSNNVT